jgi:cyclophilin family peptidyl-prolyl cis-trans isomerase
MTKTIFVLPLAVLFFLGAGCGQETPATQAPTEPPKAAYRIEELPKSNTVVTSIKNTSTPMNTENEKNVTYIATLHTTEGDIEITFNNDQTPKTVENFVTLAKKDFYNGTIFHRAITGFMIQGGDPEGTGRGGPGYKFDDEPFTGAYTRGTVAMANAGPNTNGSQFFIMHQDYRLPPNYVIFGHVTKGLDVVDKIATAKVERSSSGEMSQPVSPVKIKTVTVTEKK